MIVGTGTDIIEINRVVTACQKEHFRQKYFTENEQKLISARPGRAATNFAAKEAVSKVFGTGFKGIAPAEIEILRDDNGRPYVLLHGNARHMAQKLGITQLHISLSDCKDYAVAYAVGEGEAEHEIYSKQHGNESM